MNPNRQQFENVNVLPNIGIDESTNRGYNKSLPNKSLAPIKVDVKATRWDGPRLDEVTATGMSGADRATATGKTASEARQKAYNAVSTKRVEGAKSGETAKREAARTSFNDVTPKKTIKINSGKAN